MENILKSKRGASLIEIVATVAIASICLILIYNMLNYNIRQNGLNQEELINANIANSAMSYVKNRPFSDISAYLNANLNNGIDYAQINVNSCTNLFNDDQNVCDTVFSPVINNKVFDNTNLNVYLFPYNDPDALNFLKSTPPSSFPPVLVNYLEGIDTSNYTTVDINTNNIRVVVVVNSAISPKYDYLLQGVTTNVNSQ